MATKIYVDSDGVLADLDKWMADCGCDVNSSPEVLGLLARECDVAFKNLETIEKNRWLLNLVKNNENAFVLTALPNKPDFYQMIGDDKKADEIYGKLRKNKLTWFHRRGIPTEKIIIVERRKEKLKYCKGGAILFDDLKISTDQWTENGGVGMLVPNKWRLSK